MNKQCVYPLIGLAWLLCCVYQFKNDNMFMFVASGILSLLFFLLAVYKKLYKNK